MAPPTRYWEDYELGAVYDIGSKTMTKAEMIDFASKFDPQPFHLDEEARQEIHLRRPFRQWLAYQF